MRRRNLSILALVALALGLSTAPARGQITIKSNTVEIQEDWQLVVAAGDPANDGPQVMTYMSSVADSSVPYAWFLINVRDAPNPYAGGGLMIQVWNYSDNLVTSSTSTTATAELNTTNETIAWTQRMAIDPKTLTTTYEIMSGTSTTWGTFGSSQGLAAVTYSGSKDFKTYDPRVSANTSRVAWQANNVTSLTLLRVNQYDNKGKLLQTDTLNLTVNLTPQ